MKSPTLSPSYLTRNQYSYYFRMRVPQDMRHLFQKTELHWSLETGYLGQAKSKTRLLAGLVQKLIHHLREQDNTMNLTEKEIAEIIDTFKAFALEPYLLWNLEQVEEDGTPGIAEMYGQLVAQHCPSENGPESRT